MRAQHNPQMKVQLNEQHIQDASSPYDAPPAPPPRKPIHNTPPPLPPPPSLHLYSKVNLAPHHVAPSTDLKPIPFQNPPDYKTHLLLSKVQHLHLSQTTSPYLNFQCDQFNPYTQLDYRNSPSSGFYSCSAGSPSPTSNISFEFDYNPPVTKSPFVTTQYVRSTYVQKPLPQTAVAPPPYLPRTPPPMYTQRETSSPVKHESPVPERKSVTNSYSGDCRIKNYSPQAFMFYMEQHVENVLKSYKQRLYRRMQLEKEMAKIGLSTEAQHQMCKMLSQKESNYNRLRRAKIDKSTFVKIKLIGVGAFGEVALVRKIDSNHLYAMKTLRKVDVLKRNQIAHVKAERDILAEADNEWVVKLYYSFQDSSNLYFVMEYIPGGDLMSLLIKFGIFEESLARFYLAELTCALESVHKIGFIHRDIKPDNILIDRDGHIKLTDFGLCTGFRWTHNSKYYECNDFGRETPDSLDSSDANCKCKHLKPLDRKRKREQQRRCLAHSLVGTPNYIAPEVLLRTGYTQLCDWWSVGVVLYEMLIGSPPFSADSPTETQYKIINWNTTLRIPSDSNVSAEGIDLILNLCTSPDKRLGKNADEVKQHPFFAGTDFGRGMRKVTPPYVPTIHYLTDTSNFDPVESENPQNSSSADSDDLSDTSNTESFHGFFEFTFRRFFDDGGKIPFSSSKFIGAGSTEEYDNQVAIYV